MQAQRGVVEVVFLREQLALALQRTPPLVLEIAQVLRHAAFIASIVAAGSTSGHTAATRASGRPAAGARKARRSAKLPPSE